MNHSAAPDRAPATTGPVRRRDRSWRKEWTEHRDMTQRGEASKP